MLDVVTLYECASPRCEGVFKDLPITCSCGNSRFLKTEYIRKDISDAYKCGVEYREDTISRLKIQLNKSIKCAGCHQQHERIDNVCRDCDNNRYNYFRTAKNNGEI
jgi:hypothetical protein